MREPIYIYIYIYIHTYFVERARALSTTSVYTKNKSLSFGYHQGGFGYHWGGSDITGRVLCESEAVACMFKPKYYYQTDRMDRGITAGFRKTNSFPWRNVAPEMLRADFPLFTFYVELIDLPFDESPLCIFHEVCWHLPLRSQ